MQNKTKNLVKFLAAVIIFLGQNALAAPMISNVSGTLQNGSNITVNGNGFGIKAKVAPLLWEQFKDGNNGDLLSMHGWKMSSDNLNESKPQLSNAVVRYPEAPYSAKFYFTRNLSYYQQDLVYKENLPVSGTKRYFDYWIWYKMPQQSSVSPDSLQHQLKLLKFQSGPGDTTTGYPVLNTYAWRYTAGNRATYNEIGADASNTYSNGNYWNYNFVDGSWNHVKTMIDMGTEGNKDGILKVWLNGNQVLNTTVNFIGAGLSNAPFFNNIQIGKYLGNTTLNTPETIIYYSDVYYDDSWNKVELCDGATYATCTHSEIQSYASWSDGALNISLNKGSLAGDKAYLYVTDGDGNTNASGYPVSFSSATLDITAPAAPFGLSVQ